MPFFSAHELFDLDHTIAKELFLSCEYPWECLPKIRVYIQSLILKLPEDQYEISEDIAVAKNVNIDENVSIYGPTIIGENCELRCGAYIRGGVIIGERATIGNSCEVKNSIIFDEAQIPHFNYVGDSVIGYKAHLGAGVITSNLKSDKSQVTIRCDGEETETGLKKFGALIGDRAEIGCSAVLNPGSIIGRDSIVYPLSSVRGVVPPESILKSGGVIVKRENL